VPISVRVLSADDLPVENVEVIFQVQSGDATVEVEVVHTDASGIAQTFFVVGQDPGPIVITAIATGLTGSPVQFDLTGLSPYANLTITEVGRVDVSLSLVNVGDVFGTYLHEVALSGDNLFVPAGDGFFVMSVTDPANPQIRTYVSNVQSRDIVITGNTLYSVDRSRLHVFDITNPASPQQQGLVSVSFGSGAGAVTVAASGTTAFVTGGGPFLGSFAALQAIDVSDPFNPSLLDGSAESGGADVWIVGSTAYVAGYERGLLIYDVSDTGNLSLLSEVGTTGTAVRVIVLGDVAYILNSSSNASLAAMDVSNPSAPTFIGSIVIPSKLIMGSGYYYEIPTFLGFHVSNDVAYLSAWEGIVLVDVSDLTEPAILGRAGPRRYTGGITTKNGNIIGANLDGVVILNVQVEG
jgi:hypothetical protein